MTMTVNNLSQEEVEALKIHIQFLENELKKAHNENRIIFMAAALASTPENCTSVMAADRAYNIALACLSRL